MRVKMQWLRDYLDSKEAMDIAQVSKALNAAGLEVEEINDIASKIQNVYIATIEELNINSENEEQIICTAKIDEQIYTIKIPLIKALVKDKIALIIENNKAKYCSWSYLGFEISEPIWMKSVDLNLDIKKLSEIPEFNDYIITLGVTPNRCDALNHIGVSRELAALMDLGQKSPMLTVKEMGGPTHEKAIVEIANSQDCKRYAARVIDNIKVEESPWWLKFRLISCGIRPINNVVDVTNYVMLSRGQPMHAFDYNKLSKDAARAKICVRRAVDGEKFETLDSAKLNLSSSDIVICDQKEVIALAGVIGGNNKKVDDSTTAILLESAYFEPTCIRASSKKYAISSESSFRFERGCDPNGVVDALNYAARLLVEISNATACRDIIDVYRTRIDPIEISMRPEKAIKILGYSIEDFDQELLRKRFIKLGIETIAKRGDAIYFRIPTFRSDLTREIDLIEESARMIGFDKINSSSFSNLTIPTHKNIAENLSDNIRNFLVCRGFYEVINYAFLPNHIANLLVKDKNDLISIKNPLSERYEVMRPSLLGGILKNIDYNLRNQEKNLRLFEIGSIFLHKKNKNLDPSTLKISLDYDSYANEQNYLAAIITGSEPATGFDIAKKEQDFYSLKGIILDTLKYLGFEENLLVLEHLRDSLSYFHPYNCLHIIYNNLSLGYMGELHPDILEQFNIDKKAYAFELNLENLSKSYVPNKKYKEFSRFPIIERDVALVMDEEVEVGKIMEIVKKIPNKDFINSIKIFDIYRGKNLPDNKKSVAFSLTLQKFDSTLTDEEANTIMNNFIELAKKDFNAIIR